MHRLDEHRDMLGRGRGDDPMSEIEHVPRRRAGGAHDGGRFAPHSLRIREQHQRIEIALQRDPGADAPARLGQIDGPVEADARWRRTRRARRAMRRRPW